jgi:hypothetical protein
VYCKKQVLLLTDCQTFITEQCPVGVQCCVIHEAICPNCRGLNAAPYEYGTWLLCAGAVSLGPWYVTAVDMGSLLRERQTPHGMIEEARIIVF